ncbi:MAG: sulfite exporter TauE/SafE family protein [Hyphomicrobiales bacterium]
MSGGEPVFEAVDWWSADMAGAAGIAAAAGLMRGFSGFGSGMLMAPIFAILFGPAQAVVMVIVLEIIVSVQLVPKARHLIEWRFITTLALSATVFMPLGAWILGTVDGALLSRAMAALVLVFVLILITGWHYRGEKQLVPTLGVGAVSGTLMAATSLGIPPVLIYVLSGPDGAATNRANMIGYFALTQVVVLGVLAAMGLLSGTAVLRAVALAPAYLATAWLGARLFRKSNEILYRRVAIGFLLVVALYGLLR